MAVPRRADPGLTGRRAASSRWRRPRPLATGVVLLVCLACSQGPESVAGITDSTYVEVMARITRAEENVAVEGEEALRDIRLAVLDSAGLAPDQLVAFADSVGRDVERMLAIWEAVVARVNALQEEERGPADSASLPQMPESTPERRVIRPTDSLPGR